MNVRKFGEAFDKAKRYEEEAEKRGAPRILAGAVALMNGDKGAANVIFARAAYEAARSVGDSLLAKVMGPLPVIDSQESPPSRPRSWDSPLGRE